MGICLLQMFIFLADFLTALFEECVSTKCSVLDNVGVLNSQYAATRIACTNNLIQVPHER